jgi:hypothetical protein
MTSFWQQHAILGDFYTPFPPKTDNQTFALSETKFVLHKNIALGQENFLKGVKRWQKFLEKGRKSRQIMLAKSCKKGCKKCSIKMTKKCQKAEKSLQSQNVA